MYVLNMRILYACHLYPPSTFNLFVFLGEPALSAGKTQEGESLGIYATKDMI